MRAHQAAAPVRGLIVTSVIMRSGSSPRPVLRVLSNQDVVATGTWPAPKAPSGSHTPRHSTSSTLTCFSQTSTCSSGERPWWKPNDTAWSQAARLARAASDSSEKSRAAYS